MIEFQDPTPSDRCWATALATLEGTPLCDYSFPVLFCWQKTYGI